MSELDTKLAALRDDLHETIVPPELGHVTGRARQRTTRRRMQAGAVAAVVAVSVAVPLLRAVPADQPPAQPSLPDSMTFQLDFADQDHGYAMGSDCPVPESPCALALFATEDGGRSWARRPLPDGDKRYMTGDVSVHDANRLVVGRAAEDRWTMLVSEDGGRNWRTSTAYEPAPPAPLPRAAGLRSVCVGEEPNGSGCRLGVGAMSADGERTAPAPAQPPLMEPVFGRSATAGGHVWAAGVERTTGRWALSVSADGGTTWSTTTVTLPGDPAMTTDAWAVVEGDGVLYATLQGSIAKGPFGLLAVFRSTDGGVTWTNTWRATPKTVLQAMLGSPVATADGRLLVYSTTTGTHEAADGATFTASTLRIPGAVQWTRGGYVADLGGHAYAVSRDGITWRDFEIR